MSNLTTRIDREIERALSPVIQRVHRLQRFAERTTATQRREQIRNACRRLRSQGRLMPDDQRRLMRFTEDPRELDRQIAEIEGRPQGIAKVLDETPQNQAAKLRRVVQQLFAEHATALAQFGFKEPAELMAQLEALPDKERAQSVADYERLLAAP